MNTSQTFSLICPELLSLATVNMAPNDSKEAEQSPPDKKLAALTFRDPFQGTQTPASGKMGAATAQACQVPDTTTLCSLPRSSMEGSTEATTPSTGASSPISPISVPPSIPTDSQIASNKDMTFIMRETLFHEGDGQVTICRIGGSVDPAEANPDVDITPRAEKFTTPVQSTDNLRKLANEAGLDGGVDRILDTPTRFCLCELVL